ncbi:MAG: hypothetical protein WBD55_06615 [Dehalococcoidia bacterium]
MSDEITLQDGFYYGPLRTPANAGRGTSGNIHSDEDAQRLGFKGGLVAGSIHMEQFAPVLVRAFGERWFERGSLSLYFLTPTLHGEEVRVVVGAPPDGASDAQVEAWAERPTGERICEGTAAIGDPHEPSALHARDVTRPTTGDLRILADARAGDAFPVVDVSVDQKIVDERLKVITEPMPWYSDPARWGGAVPTTVNQVNALIEPCYAYLRRRQQQAIGLYGAIELRNVSGPMLAGRTYRAGGTLLFAGDSPKTEYVWFDTWADDASGRRVAAMRMMLRFMKASSPVYQEADVGAPATS